MKDRLIVMDNVDNRKATRGPQLVRDVMRRDVVTVVPEMTVRELVQVFAEQRIGSAPVIAASGKIVGVVSVPEALRLAGDMTLNLDECYVSDIMAPVTHTLRPADSISTASKVMRGSSVYRVLVMEDGILHGIITPFDVLELIERV